MLLLLLVLAAGIVAGFLLAVLLGLFIMLPSLERSFVFRPSIEISKTPETFGVPYERHRIDTTDGCTLDAWHVCPPEPTASVIYFHGSGGNLGTAAETFAMYYMCGLEVFGFDYRGYGESNGSPTEEGLYADGLAAVTYFNKNLRSADRPVIYIGRSLGGPVAAFVARAEPPKGLILEATFPSKNSLISERKFLRLVKYFMKYKFNTVDYLRDHRFPVMIVHGDKDSTVPLKQGQELYLKLTGPRTFLRIPGAGHSDLHSKDSELYLDSIVCFAEGIKPETIN